MSSQKCTCCTKVKLLNEFCANGNGVTKCCIPCFDEENAQHAEHQWRELTTTITSLPTLDSFYLALEDAKENEALTHIIPFHSKEPSGIQTIQLSSLGNDNIFDLDPATKEGANAFKTLAQRISQQCGDILGYQWRCDATYILTEWLSSLLSAKVIYRFRNV